MVLRKLYKVVGNSVIMGQKKDLDPEKKSGIVKNLGDGKSVIEIAKMSGRDLQTMKKYGADSNAMRRSDKGTMQIVLQR